ncbi:hypothetical protein CVT25_008676 [Psilocybe cyanescens]|uniref:Uncharacterized protein n=1 Tax=Psilocybe cyanescens TaxID=93625 RepID=A0A409XLD3_PSICY|nr:hypothetical protein CVT25_008676 [Psilocybe cyanescens]
MKEEELEQGEVTYHHPKQCVLVIARAHCEVGDRDAEALHEHDLDRVGVHEHRSGHDKAPVNVRMYELGSIKRGEEMTEKKASEIEWEDALGYLWMGER